MVRLTDVLPEGKGPQKPRGSEASGPESLPEVLILTGRDEVVDLVRGAVEERGYRLHRAGDADEVRERLRILHRVYLVLDGRHEGTAGLLGEEILAQRSWVVLTDPSQAEHAHFNHLPAERVLSEQAVPGDLLERLQLPSRSTQPAGGQRRVYSTPTPPTATPTPPPGPGSQERAEAGSGDTGAKESGPVVEDEEPVVPAAGPPVPAPEPPSLEPIADDPGPTAAGPAEVTAAGGYGPLYEDAVRIVKIFVSGHRKRANPPLNDVAGIVTRIMEDVRSSNELFLQMIHHRPDFQDVDGFLAHHMVNTVILCTKIGIGRRLPDQELFELGLAAAIHDVGMTRLPEGLVTRKGKLDPSGFSQVRQHPAYGRDIVKAYDAAYPWLPEVVYQEHERYDGSGYPEGTSGETIHPYAQILGLADTYEALTHPRTFRDGMIPFNVLQQLIRLGGRLFASELVKNFIQEISVFPLGSSVRLSTGEVGEVTAINSGYPLRPLVNIQLSSTGAPLEEGRLVDLRQEPMLYITGPVDPQERG
jgi:hypothetical protein